MAEPAAFPGTLQGSDTRARDSDAGLGSVSSRDELVARHARLVKYVVGRLGVSIPGLFDHEDAMQVGMMGLLRAIDAYKLEAAASFESYAVVRIRGAILDAIRSLDPVSRGSREASRAIQGATSNLQHELGRSPTESEMAGRLGWPVARYRTSLQAASVVTVSFDYRGGDDNDDESNSLADSAPDPNAVDPAEEAARRDATASLVRKIDLLGQRSRQVIALRYQDELTFKEVGLVLGVTQSRAHQIHAAAISTLRGRLEDYTGSRPTRATGRGQWPLVARPWAAIARPILIPDRRLGALI